MQLHVLGCSGAIAKDCRTTAFLLDQRILIDAGTGVGDLTLEQMLRIDHVFLTHAHLDHIAALPLLLDAVASQRNTPVTVHALPETIAALQAHIFNGTIWPDFSRIPSCERPFLVYSPLAVGERLQCAGRDIEVLPAIHTVPAVGYAVLGEEGWWVYTGDTGPNPALWVRLNQLNGLSMLVIETAFSSRESQLAERSLHLSSDTLVSELSQWHPLQECPVFITHTKPLETEAILQEIRAQAEGQRAWHDIFWLQTGQHFEI
jgi:ribonuclease BN (tRNA processing enzyme)